MFVNKLFCLLLFFGVCYASAGQGIDEEKIYPDWEQPEYDLPVYSEGDIDYNFPDELKPRSFLAKQPDDIVIKMNKGIDTVLGFVKETFHSLGELSIPLPDISKPFGHAPYAGLFKASKGYYKDPTTLERTGDVEIIVKSGTTITLRVQLGFKTAKAGFDDYNLDILNIHQQGTISVGVAENSLTFKLTLTYAPHCTFNLDELKFDKLNGIKVDITGLGVFQTMFNELSHWLIANFESTFREVLNKKLYETVNKTIEKKDICKYFPH